MRVGLLLLSVLLPAVALAELPGEKIFKRKCTMCHQVNGRGGEIGPDLSKVASRLSAVQLQAKVMYPKKSAPSTSMPSFATLPATEMDALLSYLKNMR